MSKENFCTWTDANVFMMECAVRAGGKIGRRNIIDIAQRLESPLELVMLGAIAAADRFIVFHPGGGADMIREMRNMWMASFDLRPAVPVGFYRADMVLELILKDAGEKVPAVVVECDGFNYHDKTREQACRDRARDRYMQREGYIVARFAGDEIVEEPFACAFDAFDLALRGIARVDRDVRPPGGWPVFNRNNPGNDIGPMSVENFTLALHRKESESEAM